MNRGRGRQKIYKDDLYYQAFISVLSEASSRFNLQVHAYCLMSNHYHLLVSTPEGNLQRAMRHIGGVYTQKYNRLAGTDGSLFKGRYKAILIDSDEYLLHVSKYIHLNPLTAKMVNELADYPWSSYPAYIGKQKAEKWVTYSDVYGQLTAKRQKRAKYKAYVEESQLALEVASFYKKRRTSPVMGDQQFKESLSEFTTNSTESPGYERAYSRPSFKRIVDEAAEYFKVEVSSVMQSKRGRGARNYPRKVAMYLAHHIGGYKLTEIAVHFGLTHYGSVGSAVNCVKYDQANDPKIRKQLNSVIKRFDP